MNEQANAVDTRERLLEIASELFAEQGYAGTSISEITKRTGANKASVNYHFGSKESLYQQTWRYAHEEVSRRYPADGGVAKDRPAAERLRGRIRAGLQRAILGDGVEHRIVLKEIANPTGLLHEVIRDSIKPLHRAMQEIIRELLGSAASDLDVQLCEVCVVSPWRHITHRRQAESHPGPFPAFTEGMLEDMTEHFTAYALAGIRATRCRIEQAGAPSTRADAGRSGGER